MAAPSLSVQGFVCFCNPADITADPVSQESEIVVFLILLWCSEPSGAAKSSTLAVFENNDLQTLFVVDVACVVEFNAWCRATVKHRVYFLYWSHFVRRDRLGDLEPSRSRGSEKVQRLDLLLELLQRPPLLGAEESRPVLSRRHHRRTRAPKRTRRRRRKLLLIRVA